MIRNTALGLVVFFLAVYAWKDWYKSLCGVIVLMAFVEHPDFPKGLFGIQGLNPWNMALVSIILAWAANRRRERLSWDMPRRINYLLLLYLGVVVVAAVRAIQDPVALVKYNHYITPATIFSEHLLNALKWPIPGLLLFDGCRSRSRLHMALVSLLAMYLLLALLVAYYVPPQFLATGRDLHDKTGRIIRNDVGYHRVTMAMMLAGACWAIFATRPLVRRSRHVLLLFAMVAVVYALALTGGRMGYVTWGVVGLILCSIRWPKSLVLIPLIAVLITWAVPGAVDRSLEGFTAETRDRGNPLEKDQKTLGADQGPDLYTITAGRNVAWPYVIAKIGEAPLFGFGSLAMMRTGPAVSLYEIYGEFFPHAHNAYLDLMLDSGLVGFFLVMSFYVAVLARAFSLFRDSRSPVFVAVGGVACGLVLAFLVAAFGSGTFDPRESSVGMWCAMMLMFRVWLQRERLLAAGGNGARGLRRAKAWRSPPGPVGAHPTLRVPMGGVSRARGEAAPTPPSLEALLWGRKA